MAVDQDSPLMIPPESIVEMQRRQLDIFLNQPFDANQNNSSMQNLGLGDKDLFNLAVEELEINIKNPTHRHHLPPYRLDPDDQGTKIEYFPTNRPYTFLQIRSNPQTGEVEERYLFKADKLQDEFKIT